ncbi:hypothetical protein MPSEU_000556000 [Mayamaea pseudoterrestris]|nr:hypothetical protein MPSEU_000556000 [Mayamaea pseudoterrestris]
MNLDTTIDGADVESFADNERASSSCSETKSRTLDERDTKDQSKGKLAKQPLNAAAASIHKRELSIFYWVILAASVWVIVPVIVPILSSLQNEHGIYSGEHQSMQPKTASSACWLGVPLLRDYDAFSIDEWLKMFKTDLEQRRNDPTDSHPLHRTILAMTSDGSLLAMNSPEWKREVHVVQTRLEITEMHKIVQIISLDLDYNDFVIRLNLSDDGSMLIVETMHRRLDVYRVLDGSHVETIRKIDNDDTDVAHQIGRTMMQNKTFLSFLSYETYGTNKEERDESLATKQVSQTCGNQFIMQLVYMRSDSSREWNDWALALAQVQTSVNNYAACNGPLTVTSSKDGSTIAWLLGEGDNSNKRRNPFITSPFVISRNVPLLHIVRRLDFDKPPPIDQGSMVSPNSTQQIIQLVNANANSGNDDEPCNSYTFAMAASSNGRKLVVAVQCASTEEAVLKVTLHLLTRNEHLGEYKERQTPMVRQIQILETLAHLQMSVEMSGDGDVVMLTVDGAWLEVWSGNDLWKQPTRSRSSVPYQPHAAISSATSKNADAIVLATMDESTGSGSVCLFRKRPPKFKHDP